MGTEGNTSKEKNGTRFLDKKNENIDYITMYIWAQNWGWFDPTQDQQVYQEAIKKVDDYWSTHLEVANLLNKHVVWKNSVLPEIIRRTNQRKQPLGGIGFIRIYFQKPRIQLKMEIRPKH